MRFFITGGTGFIGKHLCSNLSSKGDEVFVLVRPGSNCNSIEYLPNIHLIYGSMDDFSWMNHLVHPFDMLFHAAINWDNLDTKEDQTLINLFIEKGLKRLIYFSSICAGGIDLSPQPLQENNTPIFLDKDFYGKYKWNVEQYIHQLAGKGLSDAAIIRPTIVYGPGDKSNMFPLFEAIRKRNMALWDNGQNRIRFCYIDNLMAVIHKLIQSPKKGIQTYHIGDLESPPLLQVCEEIAKTLGICFRYKNYAKKFGKISGYLHFVTNRFQLTDSFATHFNFAKWSRCMEVDISKLLSDFNDLKFTSLSNALEITVKDYQREGVL